MKLENLPTVSDVQHKRATAIELRDAARAGHMEFTIWSNGRRHTPLTCISDEPIRQAVIETATDVIADQTEELRRLGVQIKPEPISDMDAAGWRRTAEMYLRAWIRELGGTLRNKRHLIDALVLTTREMRERSEKADALLAQVTQLSEALTRANHFVELGAEKLTGFMGRCADAERALRELHAESGGAVSTGWHERNAEALRLAGIVKGDEA